MQFEEFDLVLKDIQPFLSDSVFDYFISIMHTEGGKQDQEFLRENSTESESRDGKIKRDIIKDLKKVPSSGKTLKSKGSKSSGSYWYPAKTRPIREKGSGPESDILCSQLPVCRNIVSKVNLNEAAVEGDSRESSVVYEEDEDKVQETDESKKVVERSYEEIVGQIVDVDLDPGVLPPPSEMKTKLAKLPSADKGKGPKKKRACNYSHPVTNPLYRNYNPDGYIKNDEELARDFIMRFMDDFNKWLASLEGDLVQLDPEIIFKILRKDLEAL